MKYDFYGITTLLKNMLLEDDDINTVLFGIDDYRNLYKKSIYPIAHINPVEADLTSAQILEYTFEISVTDKRDLSKSKIEGKWQSNDNEIDTLNTCHIVLNRLLFRLKQIDDIFMINLIKLTPITMREFDLVDGFLMRITIVVPNDIQIC